jgi:hypothetical protein
MPTLPDGDISKFTFPNSTPIWMEDNLQKWKVGSVLHRYALYRKNKGSIDISMANYQKSATLEIL